jgi:hypothetical protein
VSREVEAALLEAVAASELKRWVLDHSGRSKEGGALVAEAVGKLKGTTEEIAHIISACCWGDS